MKLIRDGIPDDMAKRGYIPKLKYVEFEEHKEMLLRKLVEEAKEALGSNGDIGELGDVYEVLRSLADLKLIEEQADRKAEKFGRFARGIVWLNDDDKSPAAINARNGYLDEMAPVPEAKEEER